MGPQSAEWLHRPHRGEEEALPYEDRAKYYADPEFVKVPVAELISKPYARARGALIDVNHAADHPTAGDPKPADTIYMTVVDGDFNAVSLIQSNYEGFGSDHAAGDLGFGLQNRGCLFALDPNHANRLEPGKRPFHTIIPGFVTKDGKPWLSFGLMGGDMQAQGHARGPVRHHRLRHGRSGGSRRPAGSYHQGSSTPTGHPAKGGGTVALESGIGPEVRKALEAKGHTIVDLRGGAFGGYQAVRIDTERGILIGLGPSLARTRRGDRILPG